MCPVAIWRLWGCGVRPARNSECMCEDKDECNAIRDRMDRADLPSADDLLHLLAESLGYTVTRVAQA